MLALALAIMSGACGDSGSSNSVAPTTTEIASATTGTAATTTSTTVEGQLPVGPSALETISAAEFPAPLVDVTAIISGGPPPDGIPPLDNPVFIPVSASDAALAPNEPVVVLEIDGDARAYPVQVMIWHEIVNDTVGGIPVAVTYCPLCNSAVSYVREVRGVETTFGTSGRLYASALVMYDRATESLWTHFDGRAVVGLVAGDQLEVVPSPLMSWSDFQNDYPDGLVLDPTQTGFSRDYGRNPYFGYDDDSTEPFLFLGDADDRAAAKLRVVGVAIDDAAVAYSLDAIRADGVAATNAEVGMTDIVIFWLEGQASALDEERIEHGRDVGTVGVFSARIDNRLHTFEVVDGEIRDAETGSTWTVSGEAIAGELAGRELRRIPHLDTFWFAWATYRPGTALVEDIG